MKKQPPAVWFTRPINDTPHVHASLLRPASSKDSDVWQADWICDFKLKTFTRLFGLTLRPGQSVRRRIRLEVVR